MFKFTALNKEMEPLVNNLNKRMEEFTKEIESILLDRFGSNFKEFDLNYILALLNVNNLPYSVKYYESIWRKQRLNKYIDLFGVSISFDDEDKMEISADSLFDFTSQNKTKKEIEKFKKLLFKIWFYILTLKWNYAIIYLQTTKHFKNKGENLWKTIIF